MIASVIQEVCFYLEANCKVFTVNISGRLPV